MSKRLYFIFELPAFEIKLKNRKLMVNHKEVKFNDEILFLSKSWRYLGKMSARPSRDSERVELHGEISAILFLPCYIINTKTKFFLSVLPSDLKITRLVGTPAGPLTANFRTGEEVKSSFFGVD